jgi:ectoine hydroxylase-related dioxygenase (phytanoyl-CoA dioxygenase family)
MFTEESPVLATESLLNSDEQAAFRRDGFVVVRGLLSRDEALAIRDAFMDQNKDGPIPGMSEMKRTHADGREGYDKSDPLSFYPRMMHPHKHPEHAVGPLAMKYMLDRRIEAVLTELMGDRPLAVQTMFYFKPPGSRGQDFHQDNFYLKVKPGTCMAAWMALDDCDEHNGGMMCVPDTQNYAIQCPQESDAKLYFTTEHVPIPEGKHATLPTLQPGDVLFFNGSTVHGSGPNTSVDRFRRSLICHYVPAKTAELSHYYDVYDFSGAQLHHIQHNLDGGPCGTNRETVTPH